MQTPRWLLLLGSLLAANISIVLPMSLFHLATSRPIPEDGAAGTSTTSPQSETVLQTASDTSAVDSAPNSKKEQVTPTEQGSSLTDRGRLQPDGIANLPVPNTLPEVPSLADPESLERDPVFQEFRNLFNASPGEEELLSPPVSDTITQRSQAYYSRLDQRLATVAQLTASARSIAAEAASLARNNESTKSNELLIISAQLREIAAGLLIREL